MSLRRPAGRLTLFGEPKLTDRGGRRIQLPLKAFKLAAYLLDRPEARLSRDKVKALLWEGYDQRRRVANMSWLLNRIRGAQRHCGLSFFQIDRQFISIELAALSVDVVAFERLAAAETRFGVVELCQIYRGELLAGSKEDGADFERWLQARRNALSDAFVGVLTRWLNKPPLGVSLEMKLEIANRLMKADPFSETGLRVLIALAVERGNYDAARKRLERFDRRRNSELGTTVRRKVRDLLADSGDRSLPAVPSTPVVGVAQLTSPFVLSDENRPRLGVVLALNEKADVVEHDFFRHLLDGLTLQIWQSRMFTLIAPRVVSYAGEATPFEDAVERCDYRVELSGRVGSPWLEILVRVKSIPDRELLWTTTVPIASDAEDTTFRLAQSVFHYVEDHEIKLLKLGPDAATAYRLSVFGRHLLRMNNLPAIRRARNTFRRALRVSAKHIASLAGVARSMVREGLLIAHLDPSLLDEAAAFATQAVAEDPYDPRGYQELGFACLYRKQYEDGLKHVQKALELSPTDLNIRADVSHAFLSFGKPREALAIMEGVKVKRVSPVDTDSWLTAAMHFHLGNYRATLSEIEKMRDSSPILRKSAAAFALLGEHEKAYELAAEVKDQNPNFSVSQWISEVPFVSKCYLEQYEYGMRLAQLPK
jgi:DNA-binding SARP family transcriptional activator